MKNYEISGMLCGASGASDESRLQAESGWQRISESLGVKIGGSAEVAGTKSASSHSVTISHVVGALRKVVDPELQLDIWYLGLVYDIQIDTEGVWITMTFTSPFCPMGPEIIADVKDKVGELSPGLQTKVKVVFDPPWVPPDDLMTILGY